MKDDTQLLTITPEQARSKYYQRAMIEELRGGEMSLEDQKKRRIEHPTIVKYRAKILAGRGTYLDYVDWVDFLRENYAPRSNCLSVGAGLGRVEKRLIDIGFVKGFQAIDVCVATNANTRVKDQRISNLAADLNFAELRPDSFDFILCHGILHHLINLEFILSQINRALTRDGILLIYEYVGEDRWQFSEARMKLLGRRFPGVHFSPPPRSSVDGFESVRSADLLPLIKKTFGGSCDRSISFGGAYFPFLVCTEGEHDSLLDEVVDLDHEVSNSGSVSPCYHVGVYRKNPAKELSATAWTDEELRQRLDRRLSFLAEKKESFKYSTAGCFLRKVKRKLRFA